MILPPTRGRPAAAILANLLVLTVLAHAAAIHTFSPDFYHRSVQEDEYLEWASFWCFALAMLAYARAARRGQRDAAAPPFFLAGVALFCGLVAMEEISWGQRLVGYRPPEYFLEKNFQQELNLHNVVDDPIRQAAFLAVVYGWGVVLPLLLLGPRVRTLAGRLGVVAPSPLLMPGFLATGILYQVYPWNHTGEWAELMLGASMLFAALCDPIATTSDKPPPNPAQPAATLGLVWLLVLGLGASTAALWGWQSRGRPEQVEAARAEVEALRADIAAARTRTRCGIHKRLYTFVQKYEQDHLFRGEFARLTARGLPEERAEFFLDPWNSPYWIAHVCSDDRRRRAVFVYSFGPNRMRDSTDWETLGDDVAAFVIRP